MTSANGQGHWDLAEAAEAAAAEADAGPFAFAYHGADYEVPPAGTWPIKALRAVARGDFEDALGQLLGTDVFEGMCEAGLTIGELNTLFGKIAASQGMSLPNGGAPRRRGSTRTSRR